ncbi:MAG: pyridoxamine 5'-phosphate oxidase [Bacteroidota bacterium]|nr:pyridoxamine 5'-phosphate oxidase [Candidatus Kapabacteria bacterium]MCS7302874.1 pyridoxamine 5'-phosphate oxidase [Candidatus Kapabacteria bacterium]MCX7937149.1 pyridoxamine 5'-phosphate oxidase [Chlorobiota bacterium]MDW8075226.1 pyridoxamine 5'-phosphate oxidase [Bacteroidota bacterium]MDW8271839.1 pyridoxamine 5'-phosphate oxidase [Bacteroidota bacterium]
MLSTKQLAAIRREYRLALLDEHTIAANPFDQLERWLTEAINAGLPEPTAMVLATVTPEGSPAARVVLLKGIEDGKLHFYTNIESPKGQQIAAHPRVALVFYWAELERQVRIEGIATLLDRDTVAAYFATRPRPAQIGAWASRQSSPLPSRQVLEEAVARYTEQFATTEHIPPPPWWGGYAVEPVMFEFWQGRESRLHDRFRYDRTTDGWVRQRLSP